MGSHLCLQPVTLGKLLVCRKGDQDFEWHGCESQGAWCLFCRGWGGFEGFKLLLVNSFLGLLLNASFVLQTWPPFSRNGPLPPSWPRGAVPPAWKARPLAVVRVFTAPHDPFPGQLPGLCYLCLMPFLLKVWSEGQSICFTSLETQTLTTSQTSRIRVCALTRSLGNVYVWEVLPSITLLLSTLQSREFNKSNKSSHSLTVGQKCFEHLPNSNFSDQSSASSLHSSLTWSCVRATLPCLGRWQVPWHMEPAGRWLESLSGAQQNAGPHVVEWDLYVMEHSTSNTPF